jgi:mRNA interferase MazF
MKNENIHGLPTINKYTQGSVWKWVNTSEKREGTQSGERPVLIISNDSFNNFSPSVNCVSITGVLKESPVHVPLHITKDSHIQCEQIHTVPKTELADFIGLVPASTLTNVKAKLRIQLDLNTDKNIELFSVIKSKIDELSKKIDSEMIETIWSSLESLHNKADKGFGIPEIEDEFVRLMIELHKSVEAVASDVKKLKDAGNDVKQASEIAESDLKIEPSSHDTNRKKRRKYSDEDKQFIADPNNSIDDIVKRFNFDRGSVYSIRAYFKKQLNNTKTEDADEAEKTVSNESADSGQEKGVYRKYTDEDKRFIIDKSNTADDLVKRFGFSDKRAAYTARAYIKKNFKG